MDLTHFFDGLFVMVPATVGAWAAVVAARNAAKVKRQVQSPNGSTTGETVHKVSEQLTSLALTVNDHTERLGRVEKKVGI